MDALSPLHKEVKSTCSVHRPPIERVRGRYRFRLLLRGKNRPEVRAVARAVARVRERLDRMVRMSIDIDPMHMM